MSVADILKNWTVVAIDDEPDSLEVVSMILELHGASVVTASNGKEGIQLITELRPNLVITDLSMPGMSGWDLVKQINEGDRALFDIPIIALTAHASEQDRRRAIASGFTNFISKPLNPENFARQVIQLLAVEHPELQPYLEEV